MIAPWQQIQEVASALEARFGAPPAGAVVLGSGLSGLLDALEDGDRVPYDAVGLPPTSVPGHRGQIAVGRLGQARLALLGGRWHVYEGHAPDQVALGVRALARWGVRRLVLTSAVGAVDPALAPGSLVRITDHINLMGRNPLVGPPAPESWGWPRFPDMTAAYDPALGGAADALAASMGIPLERGVYAAMLGPSYETPAEIRMLRGFGARVVGMSMAPECIAAAQAGVKVVGFSVVSNYAAGLPGALLDHHDVTRVVDAAGPTLRALVAALVETW